jgi:hypothetical protein
VNVLITDSVAAHQLIGDGAVTAVTTSPC